jgi:hypothetical protein
MQDYFRAKLFDINYNILIHEGAANNRLASQAIKILLLPMSEVPKKYSKQFLELIKLIENTMVNLPSPGLTPVKITGIYNKTAVNYIKLLYDIQDYLDHD